MKLLLKISFLIFIILFATAGDAKSFAVAKSLTSSQNIEFKTIASGRIEYSPINVEDFVFGIAGIAGAFKSWLTNFISKEIVAPIEPLVANAAKQGAKEFAEGMAVMARGGGMTVLGHHPEYIDLAAELGARKFNIPTNIWRSMSDAERWVANQKFLDRMILRGDNIRLATPINQVKPGSFYQKELEYLFEKGYKISSDGLQLYK
jgi:hypothetical protein